MVWIALTLVSIMGLLFLAVRFGWLTSVRQSLGKQSAPRILAETKSEEPVPAQLTDEQQSIIRDAMARKLLVNCTYSQFMDTETYAEHVSDTAEINDPTSLALLGIHTTNASVNVSSLASDAIPVIFEKGTEGMVTLKDGTLKALTRNPDGTFREIANASATDMALFQLAATTGFITSVAQLISYAQLTKQVGQVSSSLKQLHAFREIDQRAALEAQFIAIQTLFKSEIIDWARVQDAKTVVTTIRIQLLHEAKRLLSQMDTLLPQRRAGFWGDMAQKLDAKWNDRNGNRFQKLNAEYLVAAERATLAVDCFRLEWACVVGSQDEGCLCPAYLESIQEFQSLEEALLVVEEDLRIEQRQHVLYSKNIGFVNAAVGEVVKSIANRNAN